MEYTLLFLLPIPPLALSFYHAHKTAGKGEIDLGVIFAWIVFVYSWIPLLGIILAQRGYGVIYDQRFVNYTPRSDEILTVGLCYMAFLVGFTTLYGGIRRLGYTPTMLVRPGTSQMLVVMLVFFIMLTIRPVLSNIVGVVDSTDYIGSYTKYRQFPLLVQQIIGLLIQFEFSMIVAAIVYLIIWKPHMHKYVAVVVVFMLLGAMFLGGSRSLGFLSAFAYVICYSIFVRKLKAVNIALLVGVGIVLFTVAGVFRSGGTMYGIAILAPFQGGELVSIFINSVDLLQHMDEGGVSMLDLRIYFVDLVRLIPQQFLWFEKLDPAVWYAKAYYPEYYESGGGLAFGAIAESVIGYGAAEALVRGGLLGVGYAIVANFCLSGRVGLIKAITYVWFVVISYQAVRDTTFSVFARYFLYVVPLILMLVFIREMLRKNIAGIQKPQIVGKKG